jgi:hypothetical protein
MKKTFLAFALLVPLFANSAIQLNVKARCGTDITEQTFELDDVANGFIFDHDSGVRTTIVLESESPQSANFAVLVSKDDKEVATSQIKAIYGEPTTIKCPAANIDAEMTIIATQLNFVTQ